MKISIFKELNKPIRVNMPQKSINQSIIMRVLLLHLKSL